MNVRKTIGVLGVLSTVVLFAATCRVGFDRPADTDSGVDLNLCGNGAVDDGEQCDDGNDVDQDSCTARCQLARCGDGIVRAVVEDCDDQNSDLTDGCTDECLSAGDAEATICPSSERCFGLYTQPTPWASIESSCQARGGVRAWFDDAAENNLVASALATDAPVWIGLRWLDGVSRWDWGRPKFASNFFRWAVGFPQTEASGRAVRLFADGTWQDADEPELHPYLCLFTPRWVVDPNSGHAYGLLSIDETWVEARVACIEEGGDLASITSSEEQSFAAAAAVSESAWIGLESSMTGTAWSDGEPIGYSNWLEGQPEGDRCVRFNSEGEWVTDNCSNGRPALCELQ